MKMRCPTPMAHCFGKQGYETYTLARRAMRDKKKSGVHIYKCQTCHLFHLGAEKLDKRIMYQLRRKKEENRNADRGW